MRVISKKALTVFWQRYADAEKPLRFWYTIFKKSDFENFAGIKNAWSAVDKVDKFTVFDIGGNKFRLITIINYRTRKIFVRDVLTHRQYDLENWKRE